jgi:integrase
MALVQSVTGDLFAGQEQLSAEQALREAYAAWLQSAQAADRLRQASSRAVYEDMWGAFMGWCLGQDPVVTLENLTSVDLERFLESREGAKAGQGLSTRYSWRVVNLVDRVLSRWAGASGRVKNDAAAALIANNAELRQANMAGAPPLDYLDAEPARNLVLYLSAVRPGATAHRQLKGWQELRNLTAVALHLGAGLTPVDVRQLLLSSPVAAGGRHKGVPWKLHVPANGNRPARETPIAPWAGQLLKYWLEVRAKTGLPESSFFDPQGKSRGPFLLPARGGQQWGKVAHYNAIRDAMVAAGIELEDEASGAAMRLRHTFAIRQLKRRKSPADVARWMGIANVDEMERYLGVVDNSEEAV